jgi:5-hydroxytryptamine receptor 1
MDEEEEQIALVNITLSKYDFSIMEQNFTAAQTSFRTSVIGVGILLNCVVIFVVTFSRQLYYPRHIFWAAISIFECLFLVDNAFELVTVHKHDYLACRFVVLFYPVDYSILLICMSLAALDRYLSIVRFEWYQANVTNRGAIVSITIAVGITFVVFTSPFWTGFKSLNTCTTSMIHSLWVYSWNLFLGIVCLVLHLKIFIETKTLIRHYVPKYRRKPVTVKFENKSFIRQSSNISSGNFFIIVCFLLKNFN